ncbi:hypothetical protein IGS68_04885 [Skermanella sp. TT6]|uniref:Uncharacterized protein n=1 Tax=Skermanella cutis TaxID=2775420 RepID=A0ABX7B874_9PROT|nr:hypothetical protein [Skermanella sp. TT6]QQP90583.1 hypothetical protein IGS68_04885 [Skermanella sp. TT6]
MPSPASQSSSATPFPAASPVDQLHAEYAAARDQILRQTNSTHVSECLDAIRPLWAAYQAKLAALASVAQAFEPAAEEPVLVRLSA